MKIHYREVSITTQNIRLELEVLIAIKRRSQ